MRRRHPKKDVEKALRRAEVAGWVVVPKASGHAWGVVHCPKGCSQPIWSTPREPGDHAKDIERAVKQCSHRRGRGLRNTSSD